MKKMLIILFFKNNFLSSSLVDLLQPIHREGIVVVARVPVQAIPAVPTRRNLYRIELWKREFPCSPFQLSQPAGIYIVWSSVDVTCETFK